MLAVILEMYAQLYLYTLTKLYCLHLPDKQCKYCWRHVKNFVEIMR